MTNYGDGNKGKSFMDRIRYGPNGAPERPVNKIDIEQEYQRKQSFADRIRYGSNSRSNTTVKSTPETQEIANGRSIRSNINLALLGIAAIIGLFVVIGESNKQTHWSNRLATVWEAERCLDPEKRAAIDNERYTEEQYQLQFCSNPKIVNAIQEVKSGSISSQMMYQQRRQPNTNFIVDFLGNIFGGGVKSACLKYQAEMEENIASNPIATGNYNGYDDPVIQQWSDENSRITKEFYASLGLSYNEDDHRGNLEKLFEAGKKCANSGVDFLQLKALKQQLNGLN